MNTEDTVTENNESKVKCTPEAPVIVMSSALKDRLKKCGRYHSTSPTIKEITTQRHDTLHTDKARNSPFNIKRKCVNPIDSSGDDFIKRKKFTLQKSCQQDTQAESLLNLNVDGENVTLKENLTTAVWQPSVIVNDDCKEHLEADKKRLEFEISQKNEQLRKLKMVKMYREKNNLTELQTLINTWRAVTQNALMDLLDHHPEPKPTMSQLINQLQIDTVLIGYNVEEEGFT